MPETEDRYEVDGQTDNLLVIGTNCSDGKHRDIAMKLEDAITLLKDLCLQRAIPHRIYEREIEE